MLKITNKELITHHTTILQTYDGTVYYLEYHPKQRLYVKSELKKIDADLPGADPPINGVIAHGNFIYFYHNKKIYKAHFTPTNGITVSYLRDMLEDESVTYGTCSRVIDGTKFVYRMCDDPEREDHLIDVSKEEHIEKSSLQGIHRGKAIYLTTANNLPPRVRQLGENIIVIKAGHKYSDIYINELSPFLYLSYFDNDFETLNTKNMEFLPMVEIEEIFKIRRVAGIYNGEIFVHAIICRTDYLVTAYIPPGYAAVSVALETMQKMEERIKELEASEKQWMSEKKELLQFQKDSTKDISDNASIAINSVDILSDQCCCTICSENFDSEKFIPRVLDCGHSFCEVCIYNDQMHVENKVKCPNCATVTSLPEGKILPKNFALISIAEQNLKSRLDPKITCKECEIKFYSSAVRICTKEDCNMFNQLICLACALDGDHGGHVVKYDVMIEKIRTELREEVNDIFSQIEEKKKNVLEKTEQLSTLFEVIKTTLKKAEIPYQVLNQLDNIGSEQEAKEYKEIINDLGKTIIDQCNALIDSFDSVIRTSNGLALLGDNGN